MFKFCLILSFAFFVGASNNSQQVTVIVNQIADVLETCESYVNKDVELTTLLQQLIILLGERVKPEVVEQTYQSCYSQRCSGQYGDLTETIKFILHSIGQNKIDNISKAVVDYRGLNINPTDINQTLQTEKGNLLSTVLGALGNILGTLVCPISSVLGANKANVAEFCKIFGIL